MASRKTHAVKVSPPLAGRARAGGQRDTAASIGQSCSGVLGRHRAVSPCARQSRTLQRWVAGSRVGDAYRAAVSSTSRCTEYLHPSRLHPSPPLPSLFISSMPPIVLYMSSEIYWFRCLHRCFDSSSCSHRPTKQKTDRHTDQHSCRYTDQQKCRHTSIL